MLKYILITLIVTIGALNISRAGPYTESAGGSAASSVTVSNTAATNLTQVSGSAVGTAAAGIQKVGMTDGSGNAITSTTNALDINVKSSAISNQTVNQTQIGGTTLTAADACMANAHTFTPINISTATTTRIIAPTTAKKTYLCGLFLFAAGADNIGVVEGTGGTCAVSTAGVIGGTTAATGINLAANQGFEMPVTGYAHVATAGTNVDFCLITSASVQLSGHAVWVQQ